MDKLSVELLLIKLNKLNRSELAELLKIFSNKINEYVNNSSGLSYDVYVELQNIQDKFTNISLNVSIGEYRECFNNLIKFNIAEFNNIIYNLLTYL